MYQVPGTRQEAVWKITGSSTKHARLHSNKKKTCHFGLVGFSPKSMMQHVTKTRFASSASPVAGATVVVVGAAAAVAASSPSLRATRASVDK